ncbi:hypothetical protein PHYPSEUDO_006763 [Phytophthora pseudosyringae]|uniref:Uncharacterized protein n=1 Tax=Phytophthora pseudosyringae TaxID=221518 RepID=A0A8T1VL49_9STRA|nr:hypothetical protein PHYPSEUDO_006763 [Phytophthora pseudosyringae]
MELQVVAIVLRHQPVLNALPHLGPLISNFLGPDPNLSLTKACELGSTQLLDWIWACSPTTEANRTSRWTLSNYLRSEPNYHRYQFYEGIQVAARKGDVHMVKWFFDHFRGCEVPSEAVAAAAHKGHLPVLKFLFENDAGRGCKHKWKRVELENDEWVDSVPVMPDNWNGPGSVVRWGDNALHSAVAASQVEVARWLYANIPHQTKENVMHGIVERAVVNGDFEIAELLLPPGRKIADYVGTLMSPRAIEGFLERGFLKEKKGAAAAAIFISARQGNLDLMKRIAAEHPKPPRGKNSEWLQFWEYAMQKACESGDVDMIKWVFEHPTGQLLCKQMKADDILERFDKLLPHAATGGHVEALQYLVEKGCTDKYAHAMVNAARKGHLNCIEWLLEHTYQYHPSGSADRVVLEAAKLGFLDILKFLHAPRYATEEMSTKRIKVEETGACENLRVASWFRWNFPQHVPSQDCIWSYPKNLFDTLLFIEANYPNVFTLEFRRRIKSNIADEYSKGSEFLITKWLGEKYPGRPSETTELLGPLKLLHHSINAGCAAEGNIERERVPQRFHQLPFVSMTSWRFLAALLPRASKVAFNKLEHIGHNTAGASAFFLKAKISPLSLQTADFLPHVVDTQLDDAV